MTRHAHRQHEGEGGDVNTSLRSKYTEHKAHIVQDKGKGSPMGYPNARGNESEGAKGAWLLPQTISTSTRIADHAPMQEGGKPHTSQSLQGTTHPTLFLLYPPPNAPILQQHPPPTTPLPWKTAHYEPAPKHQYRLQNRSAPQRNQVEHAASIAKSNNRPPKWGNIQVGTSLGVQPLRTDNTIQSSIPSSPREAAQ